MSPADSSEQSYLQQQGMQVTLSLDGGRAIMAHDAAVASIRDRIAHGVLHPGEQVRQQALADELGVSVVPVREALNTLQAEGLLVYRPHRGYFVAQFDLADLEEAYEIRGLLEDAAVARGVPELRAVDLAELEDTLRMIRQADEGTPFDIAAFTAAERRFQFLLFEAAGMPFLVNFIRVLWDVIAAYRALLLSDPERRASIVAQNENVLAAAAKRDAARVTAHLRSQRAAAVAYFHATFPDDSGRRRRGERRRPQSRAASDDHGGEDLGSAMLGPALVDGARPAPSTAASAGAGAAFVSGRGLPRSDPHSGVALRIQLDDGCTLVLEPAGQTLRWEVRPLVGERSHGRARFAAARLRPDVLLIDFADPDLGGVLTVVINDARRSALTVFSELQSGSAGASLRQLIRPGELIDAEGDRIPIGETRELVGTRLVHDIDGGGTVEHAYVNTQVVVWQSLHGPTGEAGAAGHETVSLWRVDGGLYLLASVGRHGTELVQLIDLDRSESMGRVFGHVKLRVLHERFQGRVLPLGRTTYTDGYLPG
jgi:DNA-binding GntR family transcriptional regulator